MGPITRSEASISTINRTLKDKGFKYLNARKKGVITKKDLSLRLTFTKNMKRGYDTSVWIKKVAFYLDGVSFWYKKNPYDQARTPKGRIWRTKDEALDISCTAKGSHVGSGGKVLHILVAISFNCGVVLCQEYEHMDGTFYSKFILEHFATILERSKKRSRLFIQDGDPSQNSASARKALKKVRANLFSFHQVHRISTLLRTY